MTQLEFQRLCRQTVKNSEWTAKEIAKKIPNRKGGLGVHESLVSRAINKSHSYDTGIRIKIMKLLTSTSFEVCEIRDVIETKPKNP